ncbi:GvpL/GvpF family gas vesicle protein [Streptomyces sp. NRRL F-5123]|uniref:GvpL/GvpF family gas vesicle protein n=1 Tax=Streptomyces sp. NRRL F-5123 TaxID=1463856 RepID=UPI0004E1BF6C|nr:GvpL/GvpF family gas vesicle protein [Streptomyces sp. NRRL F-5123]
MTAAGLRQPSGAPAEAATATCVFAVRREGGPGMPADAAGHPGGSPLELLPLPGTGLSAVVQAVPAADFTQEALQHRLGDPAALEACARTHHAVVTAAAGAGPVVPMPLATLFTDRDRAVAALAEQVPRLRAALDRVTGRAEWSVKAEVRAPDSVPAGGEGAGRGADVSGAAYLARVRGRERDRQARQEAIRQVAAHVHHAAAAFAVAAVRRPPHGTAVTGKDRHQILNAAFLVDDGRAPDLVAAVHALNGTHAGLGLHIDVSGPWVPYSFTGECAEAGP